MYDIELYETEFPGMYITEDMGGGYFLVDEEGNLYDYDTGDLIEENAVVLNELGSVNKVAFKIAHSPKTSLYNKLTSLENKYDLARAAKVGQANKLRDKILPKIAKQHPGSARQAQLIKRINKIDRAKRNLQSGKIIPYSKDYAKYAYDSVKKL